MNLNTCLIIMTDAVGVKRCTFALSESLSGLTFNQDLTVKVLGYKGVLVAEKGLNETILTINMD